MPDTDIIKTVSFRQQYSVYLFFLTENVEQTIVVKNINRSILMNEWREEGCDCGDGEAEWGRGGNAYAIRCGFCSFPAPPLSM